MCRSSLRPSSIFCIVPPYIFRSIAVNGSAQQRAAAVGTLMSDQTFRTMRVEGSARPASAPPLLGGEAERRRSIYSAQGQETLPGVLARAEDDGPTGDPSVDEAFDGLGATYDLYWEQFSRSSIDDEGLPLNATVHFGQRYNNAFWNGEQMVFGDGDGELFNRFTIAIDVIGHELAHGVTQDEAALRYTLQPGALNESLSDVFGALVKQYRLGQSAAEADWLIGAGLFTATVNGEALRSMKAPGTAYDDPLLGKDPQPAHMDDFVRTLDDNGGVHINSGIPNRAFYLAAVALGGNAWERAGRIWYETLRDSQLRSNTGFRRFAGLTVRTAGRLYGQGGEAQRAVAEAWAEVGLPVAL
jgi:Zn-dependent metalloprotease